MTIKFYNTGSPYDIFSNVTDIGFAINLNGKDYTPRSSEAVYQGIKGLSLDVESAKQSGREILKSRHAGRTIQSAGTQIKNIKFHQKQPVDLSFKHLDASELNKKDYPTETFSERVMYETLLCKFTQNPSLLKALLATQDQEIVEDSGANDAFWGNGDNNKGRNTLGKVLMKLRTELQQELNDKQQIAIRAGLSDELAGLLGFENHRPNSQLTGEYYTGKQLSNYPIYTTVAEFKSNQAGPSPLTITTNNNPQPNSGSPRISPPTPDLRHFCKEETYEGKPVKDGQDENNMFYRRIQIDAQNPNADVLVYQTKMVCQEPLDASIKTMASLMAKAKQSTPSKAVLINGELEDIKSLAQECKSQGLQPHVLHHGKPITFDAFMALQATQPGYQTKAADNLDKAQQQDVVPPPPTQQSSALTHNSFLNQPMQEPAVSVTNPLPPSSRLSNNN